MASLASVAGHRYQLVLQEDGLGSARRIEFEAMGPDIAFSVVERDCRGREAELFEDGRSLGRIKCSPKGGYWLISRGESEVATRPDRGAGRAR